MKGGPEEMISGEQGAYRLLRAVFAGFLATLVATLVISVAFWAATIFGSAEPQAHVILRWIWGLAHNIVTQDVQRNLPLALLLHLLTGIGWAIAYTVLVEPRLHGSGWRRGMIFSLGPWVLSLVVFLPAVGGGFLGLGLGAGPLPIIGNLIVHLAYGATLGQMSAPGIEHPVEEHGGGGGLEEMAILVQAHRTMALGIVFGLLFGALIGLLFGSVFWPGLGPYLPLLLGAFLGGVMGLLVGSFWGLASKHE